MQLDAERLCAHEPQRTAAREQGSALKSSLHATQPWRVGAPPRRQVRQEQASRVSHGRFDGRRVRPQRGADCNAKQQVEHGAGEGDLRPKLACSKVVQAA